MEKACKSAVLLIFNPYIIFSFALHAREDTYPLLNLHLRIEHLCNITYLFTDICSYVYSWAVLQSTCIYVNC